MTHSFDWSLLQTFLAVAHTGSLSAAARELRLSQPTVGRHIQTLEEQVGAELFVRQAKGMALSDAGRRLLEPAERMREAAGQLALTVAGADADMAGTVRVTASTFTSQHHLPRIIAKLRAEAPEIQLEIVPSNTSENLLFREADIAVRHYRPRQLDVIAKHIGDFSFAFFASPAYLQRKGTPMTAEDLLHHDLLGYDRSDTLIQGMRQYGFNVTREDFPVRVDNFTVYWELIRAGAGIGIMQKWKGLDDPNIVHLLPDADLPGLPVWLVAHEALRGVPRMSRVWAELEAGLTPLLEPPGRLRLITDDVEVDPPTGTG